MESLVNEMTTEQYFRLLEIADGKVSDELRSISDDELLAELIE